MQSNYRLAFRVQKSLLIQLKKDRPELLKRIGVFKEGKIVLYLPTDTNRRTVPLCGHVCCLSPDSMLLFAALNIYEVMFKEELIFRTLTCTQLLVRGVYIARMFVGSKVQKAGLLLG